jgi:tetratricopeptide (TPR) repeat protein
MRRAGVLILAGLVLVVVLAARRRLNDDPNRVFIKADTAFKAGRHVEADAALRRLERLRAPTPVDRLLRAEVAQALKDPERALAELAAIPDDHPTAPLARLRAGQFEIHRGRTRPAEAAFKASLKLLTRGVPPRKELVYIYNIQHRQAELDAMLAELMDLDALDFAYILHWTKTRNTVWNPNGDLPALERFVAADGGDRWSRLALVEALRRLDRLAEAEKMLAPLPEADQEARAERILLAMDRGDFAAAESLLAGGPDDHPGLARLRGQLALRRRQGEAAARQFRIAVAADPTDRLALHGLGTALGMLGQSEAARPYLEAARRHDALWALVARAATTEGENDPHLPRQLGIACAAIGRNLEARAWLRLALRRDPLDAEGQKALYRLEHPPECRSTTKDHREPIREDG